VVRAERIYENTGMGIDFEFRSSKGRAVWPEGELEDFVCDVACAIVTVILRV
jgi:hypothetical protein